MKNMKNIMLAASIVFAGGAFNTVALSPNAEASATTSISDAMKSLISNKAFNGQSLDSPTAEKQRLYDAYVSQIKSDIYYKVHNGQALGNSVPWQKAYYEAQKSGMMRAIEEIAKKGGTLNEPTAYKAKLLLQAKQAIENTTVTETNNGSIAYKPKELVFRITGSGAPISSLDLSRNALPGFSIADYQNGRYTDLTKAASYRVSDSSVVKIIPCAGECVTVEPVGPGTATITATVGGVSKTLTVTVPKMQLKMMPMSITAAPGTKHSIGVLGSFPITSEKFVSDKATWTSSNPSVAEILPYKEGQVILHSKRSGTATITATLGGSTVTLPVIVQGTPQEADNTPSLIVISKPKTEETGTKTITPGSTVQPSPNPGTGNTGTEVDKKAPTNSTEVAKLKNDMIQLEKKLEDVSKKTDENTSLLSKLSAKVDSLTNTVKALSQAFLSFMSFK